MAIRKGRYTIYFQDPPSLRAFAAVGCKKEGEGPLGACFDQICEDAYCGQKSWEQAESFLQQTAIQLALQKAHYTPNEIQALFAGDLLNQCVGSTYGARDLGIPFIGLFGACSTMAESLLTASVFLEAGAVEHAIACTSSHFCSAERQFRFPLEYGGQRTPTSQWTATASGAVVTEHGNQSPFIRAATIGTIEDLGICDANNMGAAMAPAAAATLQHFFEDTGTEPQSFDLIATGDLGQIGSDLLLDLLRREGYDLRQRHNDCGLMLYDRTAQDVHAGASGCGCSASVLCGHLLPMLRDGSMKNLLFIATGALMSPTIVQQGESIASIAHLLWISHEKKGGGL